MNPNILEEFYLEAARQTYAGGMIKATIPDLPKSKVYRYERGELLYVDMYWTNGEYSSGKTLVYADEVPVWTMDYDGWCKADDPEVLAFLKKALNAAYAQNLFHGGRGPERYYETEQGKPGLCYTNNTGDYPYFGQNNEFRKFYGREDIHRFPGVAHELFWHRYKGLLLQR